MICYLNEMLNLRAQENPEIIEWVRKRDKKYTSPEIQNELVEAMVLGMSRTDAQIKVRSKMKETNRGSVDPRSLAVNLCKTTKQQNNNASMFTKNQSLIFTFKSYLKRQEKTISKTKWQRCGECDRIATSRPHESQNKIFLRAKRDFSDAKLMSERR